MALRHAVHGWDQVTRYVDMTPEEEAEFEAGRQQAVKQPELQALLETWTAEDANAPAQSIPPLPPPVSFTPEPLPEPLEAADQPDDDPIPRFLQTPPTPPADDAPGAAPEPSEPAPEAPPTWTVGDLLAASGPPPAPVPPQEATPEPVELPPPPDAPAEPVPASEPPAPSGITIEPDGTMSFVVEGGTSTTFLNDPIAEAVATQTRGPAMGTSAPLTDVQREFNSTAAPGTGGSVTHHYREEKTIVDETWGRAEIRYQVAVMAKNGSHRARQKLVGPARRRGVTVEALYEQIIQEREALEQKVLEDF